MKFYLLASLTLGLTANAAASDQPVSLGPLAGTGISVLVDPDDAQVVLATNVSHGLMRSADGGQTFEPYGTGLPQSGLLSDLTLDPKNHDRVLMLANNELWQTLNFGQSWSTLGLVGNGLQGVAISNSSNDIFAAAGTALHRSTDNGVSWNVVDKGVLINEVALAPSDPTRVLYGSLNGLFLSTDGGATFAATGMTNWAKAAIFHPTNSNTIIAGTPGSVVRSTDGGTTFAAISGGLPGYVTPGFFSFAPNGFLWVGMLDGMWASADGGSSWFSASQGLPIQSLIPTDISFDSGGDIYISAEASGGGVWRTQNQQLPWLHIGFRNHAVFSVAYAGTTRVMGSHDGVYSGTTDMATTAWQYDLGTHTEALSADPADATMWVSGGVGAFIDNAQIAVLTGDGTAALKVYEAGGAGAVVALERDPFNSNHLVGGIFDAKWGNPALIYSGDGGVTWLESAGTAGWATWAVTFDPFVQGRLLEQSENGQWAESLDGGVTWGGLQPAFPVTGPATLLAFDPNRQGTIYRGDLGSGLHRSDDDGATWTALNVPLWWRSHVEFAPGIPGLVWVSDSQGDVLLSLDFGATWSVAFHAPLSSPCTDLDYSPELNALLIGTTSASLWELPAAAPFVSIGGGSAGSAGIQPRHFAQGGLPEVGSLTFGFAGDDAIGGALAILAISLQHSPLPLFGGTLHPATPFFSTTVITLGGAPGIAGDGSFGTTIGIPASGALVGLDVISQFAVVGDPGAADPSGIVLSNGLVTTLLP